MKRILRLFSVFAMVLPLSTSLVSCSNVLTFYQKEAFIIKAINYLELKDGSNNFSLNTSDFVKVNDIVANYFSKKQIFSLSYSASFKKPDINNVVSVEGNFNLDKNKRIFNNNISKIDYNAGFYTPYFNQQKNLLISNYDNLQNNKLVAPKDFDIIFNADGWTELKNCLADNNIKEMINFVKNNNFFIKALPKEFSNMNQGWWVKFIKNIFSSIKNNIENYQNIDLNDNNNAVAIFHFDNYGTKLKFSNLSSDSEKQNFYFAMNNIPNDSLFPIAFEDNSNWSSNMKTMILNGSLLSLAKNIFDAKFGNKNWKVLGIAALLIDNNFLFSGLTINKVANQIYSLFDEGKITDDQIENNTVSLFEF